MELKYKSLLGEDTSVAVSFQFDYTRARGLFESVVDANTYIYIMYTTIFIRSGVLDIGNKLTGTVLQFINTAIT